MPAAVEKTLSCVQAVSSCLTLPGTLLHLCIEQWLPCQFLPFDMVKKRFLEDTCKIFANSSCSFLALFSIYSLLDMFYGFSFFLHVGNLFTFKTLTFSL